MNRREKVIAAITDAIEGKKWQLIRLEENYNQQGIEGYIQSVRQEQAMYRELLSEIKDGKRI